MKNDLQQFLKEGKISSITIERVQIAKHYIEKKYQMKKSQEEEKKKELDILNSRLEELNISAKDKDQIKRDILKREIEFLRLTYLFYKLF